MSFKVSSNGKQVKKLKLSNVPIFCEGGGPALPTKFKNAAISDADTFKSRAKRVFQEGPSKGDVQVKLKVAGRFLKRKRASGTHG